MRQAIVLALVLALVLPLVLVAGCLVPAGPSPGPDPDPGTGGWTNPQGFGCTSDVECGTQLCARDGACYPATSIREAHVLWTVRGAVASTTSCAPTPNLLIEFYGSNGEAFGFAPVPCRAGAFIVDKLPTAYTRVELGVEGATGTSATIDRSSGEARIDLR